MPLLLAGIDEAGYGPLLGPLCVGMSSWVIDRWSTGDPAPNLWSVLSSVVTQKPRDARKRLAIADSKALKLPNDTTTRHPLTHLERGVLVCLRALGEPHLPTDHALFTRLGFSLSKHRCYAGDPVSLPVDGTADSLSIAANLFTAGTASARCRPADLRVLAIVEPDFNSIVRDRRSKAATTLAAIRDHLTHLLTNTYPYARSACHDLNLRIVCDRLGGRAQYADVIADLLPGAEIQIVAESDRISRYTVQAHDISFGIGFEVDSESAHLPVALASMAAKYARELAMLRFNRYWTNQLPELKPTAGYYKDAKRWLKQADAALTPADKKALIRIA